MNDNVHALPGVKPVDSIQNEDVRIALGIVPADAPVMIAWMKDGQLHRIHSASVMEMVWMCEAIKQNVMFA